MIDIESYIPHLPAWLLVVFRLAGLFMFAPVLSSKVVHARVKAFLAIGLSCCVYPALVAPGAPAEPLVGAFVRDGVSLWSLPVMIAMEMAIGSVIGVAAMMPFVGLQMAGQVADQQMGLGLASVLNPDFEEESGVTGQFYYTLAAMIYLIMGGHRMLFATVVDSFSHVPLGGFRVDAGVVGMVIGLLSAAFELAIRVSAPLLCLVFLETVAMGFLSRTAPQLNLMSLGFALRILAGSAVILAAMHTKFEVFTAAMQSNLQTIHRFFAGHA